MAEAYLCDAVRTPVGRYGGKLAGVRPDDLMAGVLQAILQRNPQVPAAEIDDVLVGAANQAGEDNRNTARMALLLAGLPESVPGMTVNRLCASGLSAVTAAARSIRAGEGDLFLAGGAESMSRAPFVTGKPTTAFPRADRTLYDTTLGWRFANPRLAERFPLESMAETAENVADRFGISREEQDAFALESQRRWARAAAAGRFDAEIVPVEAPLGRGTERVAIDEHPRPDTTAEGLSRLRPIVRLDGTVTAGNASGVNDGAAVVLLASEQAVQRFGLRPRARFVASAEVGVDPRYMGMGPVPALRKALARANLQISDLGLVELNEAFASQSLACIRELGLDPEIVNPNGGAIAIGHPLGMTGARLCTTVLHEFQQRAVRYAAATLCVGVGQGVAAIFERIE
ncbi:MAG: acetyl-CoA C-acyltransferase [Thermaerobacter sp.]|nr:acetyl-CoA C-acyltransferase [Thermaerobacter sp.]